MKKLLSVFLASACLASCATSPVWPEITELPPDPNDPLDRAYLAYHFSYCDPATGNVIVVPAGFRTDYTSIPFPANLIFPRRGRKYVNAAYVHDYLYGLGLPEGRDYADLIMLRAMEEYDVDWFTRHIIYLGIHFGGEDGYGLEQDWVFMNPDGTPRDRVPKPTLPYKINLPNCEGYEAMVLSGELFDGPAAPVTRRMSQPTSDDGPQQP